MKRRWTIGTILALAMLALLGAFAVSAATVPASDLRQLGGPRQEEREQRRTQVMDRVAQKLGVAPERLKQAFTETRDELGIGERMREHRRGRDGESGPRGFGPRDGEREMGRMGPGGFGGPAGPRGMMGRQMEIAASTIGITPEQLRGELRGSTLEAVARAHGINPQSVAGALQANARDRMNQAVASGHMTQESADQMLERVSQAIQRLMTTEVPDRPGIPNRFRGEPRS